MRWERKQDDSTGDGDEFDSFSAVVVKAEIRNNKLRDYLLTIRAKAVRNCGFWDRERGKQRGL